MFINSYETIYEFLFPESAREKWLFQNHYFLPTIVVAYVLTSFWLGPLYMKNRKPYSIKPVIFTYDVFQVFANIYLFMKLAPLAFTLHGNFSCGFDSALKILDKGFEIPLWHLLLLKHLDFLDTIFFILRKKGSHVSVLHVIHHATVAFSVFYTIRFDHRLICFFAPIVLNAAMHAVVYLYYASTVIDLEIFMKYKSIVTTMQIMQFIIIMAYIGALYFSGCIQISKVAVALFVFVVYLLIMFIRLYRDMYLKEPEHSMKES